MRPRKHKRSTHWLDVADLERFFGLGWIGPSDWIATLGRGKTENAALRKWERFKAWLVDANVPHGRRWAHESVDGALQPMSVTGLGTSTGVRDVVQIKLTADALSYLAMTDTHEEWCQLIDFLESVTLDCWRMAEDRSYPVLEIELHAA